MEQKYVVASDQFSRIMGQILEIQRQISQEGGSPLSPVLVSVALKAIIEGRVNFLKDDIGSCDGTESLYNATDVFVDGLVSSFSGFEEYGLDHPCVDVVAVPAMSVRRHELVKDKPFEEQVSSFGDLDILCFTQHQIKDYCKKHKEEIEDKKGCLTRLTCFLFKEDGEFFVAYVEPHIYGLLIGAIPYGAPKPDLCCDSRCLIVPKWDDLVFC